MYNPIFNKIIGTVKEKDGYTHVTFRLYKGLTDLISLLFIFVVSFLILSVRFYELNVFSRAGLSLLCCFFAASITFCFTWLSEDGQDGEVQLVEFVKRNLELRQLNQ